MTLETRRALFKQVEKVRTVCFEIQTQQNHFECFQIARLAFPIANKMELETLELRQEQEYSSNSIKKFASFIEGSLLLKLIPPDTFRLYHCL